MEEQVQLLANRLSQAINNGDSAQAVELIRQLAEQDAAVQIFTHPRNLRNEEFAPQPMPRPQPVIDNPHAQEIFAQLLEMGVEDELAHRVAYESNTIEDALAKIYQ